MDIEANGGSGNDTVTAISDLRGGHFARLNGGGGHDRLVGGNYENRLVDGDTSGAADRDLLEARGVENTVSYATRTAPVRIDLTNPAPDGERGERDVLRGFGVVEGGSGRDVLRGAAGPNEMDGGRGADRLNGRSGDDLLIGGSGADTLRGGPGGDYLLAGMGADRMTAGPGADTLVLDPRDRSAACGAGADIIGEASWPAIVPADCEDGMSSDEESEQGMRFALQPRRRDRRSVSFAVGCVAGSGEDDDYEGELTATIRITRGGANRGTLLGRGAVRDRRCSARRPRVALQVHLNAAGRALASRRRGVLVHVTLKVHDDFAEELGSDWGIRLAIPR